MEYITRAINMNGIVRVDCVGVHLKWNDDFI